MNRGTVEAVRKVAMDLIHKADEVVAKDKAGENPFYGCKETGSLRRASLELTRALAEMRKAN